MLIDGFLPVCGPAAFSARRSPCTGLDRDHRSAVCRRTPRSRGTVAIFVNRRARCTPVRSLCCPRQCYSTAASSGRSGAGAGTASTSFELSGLDEVSSSSHLTDLAVARAMAAFYMVRCVAVGKVIAAAFRGRTTSVWKRPHRRSRHSAADQGTLCRSDGMEEGTESDVWPGDRPDRRRASAGSVFWLDRLPRRFPHGPRAAGVTRGVVHRNRPEAA